MKKIAITTLSNSINYGGILQACALNYVLKKYDCSVTFITHQAPTKLWNSAIAYAKRRIKLYGKPNLKNLIRLIGGMGKTYLSNIHIMERYVKIKKFKLFINYHLNVTPYYRSFEEVKKYCSNFDVYITGSDQVWNTAFNFNQFDPVYFLEFVSRKKKKYSYAASAGGDKSNDYVKCIVDKTSDFSGISVREQSLANQMNNLGANNVIIVLDPTLLLSSKDWLSYEKKPKIKLPKRYIAVYYLEKEADRDDVIKKVSSETGLPVINLLPVHAKAEYNSIKDFTTGPGEFLYYIHNAEYVITNSFHAVVFSLIFKKKFIALPRVGQEARIRDLLGKLQLNNRLISNEKEVVALYGELPDDIENALNLSKKESVKFIENILK